MKNRSKIFLLLASVILAVVTAVSAAVPQPGQLQKPANVKLDMDKIKAEVTNPKSPRYYPKLMATYERNETIMTLEDYRYLYFGAIFQEDYDPYRKSALDGKTEEIYFRNNHTRAELDSIIAYAEHALEDDPFDLQQINFLIYALQNRQKYNRAKIWQYRLNHLLAAILTSGTGLDMENAWVIIDPKHEYYVINFHNQLVENAQFVEPYYDYVVLAENPDSKSKDPEGYYFNLKYILQEYYRKHPEQAD